jgi:hypothetical protein
MFSAGYGTKYRPSDRKQVRAHRWIWEQVVGPIPDGIEIHHRCENRACVRPDHLEALTAAQHLRLHGRYTREDVLAAIRGFEVRYGRLPDSIDWNPTSARINGRIADVERFYADGCWPHTSTARALFGSWRAAVREYEAVRTLQEATP